MSDISTAYDAIRTAITTAVPGLTELPNPYTIDENPEGMLRNGYGLTIGQASRAPFQEFNSTWTDQEFTITLTREVLKTDHNPDPVRTVIKAIHEDLVLIVKEAKQPEIYPHGVVYVSTSAPSVLLGDKHIVTLAVTISAKTQSPL